ncbi:MAG: hypothetical protein DI634_07015 [Kocuria palustris]|nr:MAG: hypothetical protein DI634_07015 [Kocuria palustris]
MDLERPQREPAPAGRGDRQRRRDEHECLPGSGAPGRGGRGAGAGAASAPAAGQLRPASSAARRPTASGPPSRRAFTSAVPTIAPSA